MIVHCDAATFVIDTVIASPGRTVIEGIVVSAAGRISHHAAYFAARPVESCSVPAWMRFAFVNPSMPTQAAEYATDRVTVTAGTVQCAVTLVYAVPDAGRHDSPEGVVWLTA